MNSQSPSATGVAKKLGKSGSCLLFDLSPRIAANNSACHSLRRIISAGAALKGLYVPKFDDLDGMRDFARELESSAVVALDFSRVGFATPTGMLVLASLIEEAVRVGRVPIQSGITPRDYPSNMGFYTACGFDVPNFDSPGGANYYPITRFDVVQLRARAAELKIPIGAHVNVTVGRLAYLITHKTSGELFYTVKYCLREILRNVAEHSQSDHLLVMGQYWPETNKVELAVLDRGIGLRAALSKNSKFSGIKSDRDAIRIALLPSTSGTKVYDASESLHEEDAEGEWGNSGFGLYVTSQMARRTGSFTIASCDARLEITGNQKRYGAFFLSGTLVSIKMDLGLLGRLEPALKQISDRGEAIAKRFLTSGAEVLASAASRLIMKDEG